jgi:hypothetical protein
MAKAKKRDYVAELEKAISENPGLHRLLNRLFLRQSIKMGLTMAALTAGLFSVANALITGFGLGWVGWLVLGTILSSTGLYYVLREWRR